MCRRGVFGSLVDVCGLQVGNSLILMGGAAVNPLHRDRTTDYNWEISHLQSPWFSVLYVIIYLTFLLTLMRDLQLNFLLLYIPVWAFYSGSDNQPVILYMPITNARDRESYFSYPPVWYLFCESLHIFKVNLKTFLFPTYVSSDIP